jgi:hypothetical protein
MQPCSYHNATIGYRLHVAFTATAGSEQPAVGIRNQGAMLSATPISTSAWAISSCFCDDLNDSEDREHEVTDDAIQENILSTNCSCTPKYTSFSTTPSSVAATRLVELTAD